MRTRTRARRAIAAALAMAALVAEAAGTHTLAIGTTILSAGSCRFETPGATLLDFGSIDPSSTTNATATIDVPFRCTGGGSAPTLIWSVSSDNGLHETGPGLPRLRHAVNIAQFLPYTLNLPASGSAPKNSVRNLTLLGTIQVADFANAIPGVYADSVVLTMAP